MDALYEKFKKDNPDAASNPFSRWQQKNAIKKEYAAAKAGKETASKTATATKGAGKATGKAAQGAKNITEKVTEFATTHSKAILLVLAGGLLFMIIASMFSSCGAMFQGGTQVILGTSFTAKDEDIIGADDDYKALEAALRNKINNIERTHSGYDEYRYDLDEINHNPYELAVCDFPAGFRARRIKTVYETGSGPFHQLSVKFGGQGAALEPEHIPLRRAVKVVHLHRGGDGVPGERPLLHRRGQLAPLVQQGVHHPRPYGVGVGEEVGEVQLFPRHGVKLLTEQKDGGVVAGMRFWAISTL